MKFQIVGHACLAVEASGKRLVVDPWILGSVYWGAWWHCPRSVFDDEIFGADFLYITHWHFDHFHAESLARFNKSCRVLVPKFPVSMLVEQLNEQGFHDVVELDHGVPYEMAPDFRLTSWQIQYQDDSVCAVESGGTVLVDVNDSKPLPRTWRQITRRFPRVDFMLRSHSPAWSYPWSFTFEEPNDAIPVDAESYVQAFRGAAALLKPRYAIPFASSVCHPHREVLDDNGHLVSPYALEEHMRANPVEGTELVLLGHGSTWSSEDGFTPRGEPVRDAAAYAKRLAEEESAFFADLYAREAAQRPDYAIFERFFRAVLRSLFPLRPFLGARWSFPVDEGGRREHWVVDVRRGRVERRSDEPADYTSRIEVHPAVLADALATSTFTNIDISKRWKVHVRRGGLMKHLLFWVLISLHEASYFRARRLLTWRFVRGWIRRRGEILDYLALGTRLLRNDSSATAASVTDPGGAA